MSGLRKVSDWLYRVSPGWVVLATLVVFVLFSVLVLPGQAASAQENSGGGGTPDLSLFYSAGDLYRMAEAHGQAGREAFVQARWTFDLAFPLVYGAFLITAISWLFARVSPAGSAWRLANLAPVLAVILDYLENTCTSLVMLRYPAHTPVVDSLAGVLTCLKWLFVVGSIVLLLAGLWRWLSTRNRR
jgi:hypothetical protein